MVLSLISRAAAGVGDLARFTSAWAEAWRIIDTEPATDRACAALYNLAYASANLGDWVRARMAGQLSAAMAESSGEAEIHRNAVRLLEDVGQEAFEPSLSPRPEEPEILEGAEELARRLVVRLAACAG